MSEAGQKMIEGLKEAITMNSLMIENKMLAAELRQADDMALNQALTIKKLQEENETLRRDVKTAVMGDSAELADVKRENERLREALKRAADRDEERRKPIRLVGSAAADKIRPRKGESFQEALEEIARLRAENEKLRNEVMSDYHEGWEEGVKAERERCAMVAEQARDDTCDGPVAWSMADCIAAAIRETGRK